MEKKSELGDWLFLIGMGGMAGGYLLYENKTDVAGWLSTMQAKSAAGTAVVADHWGMIALVISLVVAGIWLLGDSMNKQTTLNATTDKLQVHRPYRTVMKSNGAKEIQ